MAERGAREERDDLLRGWWDEGRKDGAAGKVSRMPLREDPKIGEVYIDGFNVGRRERLRRNA